MEIKVSFTDIVHSIRNRKKRQDRVSVHLTLLDLSILTYTPLIILITRFIKITQYQSVSSKSQIFTCLGRSTTKSDLDALVSTLKKIIR
jgi:hypothetical protein